MIRRAFRRRSAVSGSSGISSRSRLSWGRGRGGCPTPADAHSRRNGMQGRTIRDSLRLMARLRLRPMRVAVTDTRPLRPRGDRLAGDHLGTQAHRQWAKTILRASGGVCQWPGCAETKGLVADHRIRAERSAGTCLRNFKRLGTLPEASHREDDRRTCAPHTLVISPGGRGSPCGRDRTPRHAAPSFRDFFVPEMKSGNEPPIG